MIDWASDPRLWIAMTPFCVFIGATIAFYLATESGDADWHPAVSRGGTDWEPWGTPVDSQQHRLPGDSVVRSNRVPMDDTAHLARINDERNNDTCPKNAVMTIS